MERAYAARCGRPAGRGRKARLVEQELRAERVELADRQGGKLEVPCLIAAEINAPAGTKPVCWRLLTNHAAPTLAAAVELLDGYRARWEIELFFLVLKEGCRVERLQLADTDRMQTALALYMVIAWRINRLMRLGRTLPDLPADLVFEHDEWRAPFILNKKPVPKTVPPLNTVLRLIAQRGSFLARRHDGEPGAKTIWPGLRRSPPSSRVPAMRDSSGRGEMCVMGWGQPPVKLARADEETSAGLP